MYLRVLHVDKDSASSQSKKTHLPSNVATCLLPMTCRSAWLLWPSCCLRLLPSCRRMWCATPTCSASHPALWQGTSCRCGWARLHRSSSHMSNSSLFNLLCKWTGVMLVVRTGNHAGGHFSSLLVCLLIQLDLLAGDEYDGGASCFRMPRRCRMLWSCRLGPRVGWWQGSPACSTQTTTRCATGESGCKPQRRHSADEQQSIELRIITVSAAEAHAFISKLACRRGTTGDLLSVLTHVCFAMYRAGWTACSSSQRRCVAGTASCWR